MLCAGEQDPVTKISSCVSCGAGAVAVGTTFGQGSCQCNQGFPTLSDTGVVCSPCPTGTGYCSPTPTSTIYNACPHTKCGTAQPPPFSTAIPSAPLYACAPHFVTIPSKPNIPAPAPPSLSGSGLYTTASAWSPAYAPLPYSTCEPGSIELVEVRIQPIIFRLSFIPIFSADYLGRRT